MEDDLNTPRALASLYDLVSDPSPSAGSTVRRLGRTLGLFSAEEAVLDSQIQQLVQAREEARAKKDFTGADRIRRQLMEQGYLVEDTAAGPVVRRRVTG